MPNLHLSGTLPPGATIRIGQPAEEPVEAIAALQRHFLGRPMVRAARVGLMEVVTKELGDHFTYTVGIVCEPADTRESEELAAIEVLKEVPTGRWPISFFQPSERYFTPDARVFYQAGPSPRRPGFLRRLFGG